MLALVVPLEALVRRQDLARNCEVVRRRVERPEVRTKYHDGEVDLEVGGLVCLLHALLELVCEILGQVHVCKERSVIVPHPK